MTKIETDIQSYECDWCWMIIKYNPLIHSAKPDIHMSQLSKSWDEIECWVFYKVNNKQWK